ncbi:MAG: TIGR02099 family protein [Betaproteobacteria bacterium RBG_16_66_20]|nr:MAG: TIGR02099 family protein [Betaproteobacteria bacterium RBG_16_66_20]
MRIPAQTPLRNLLRALEILAWAAFFAFAALFLALRYWLLPNVEQYRADIVAAISSSIGLPVKIGALATDWQGLRPRLSISDVRVYDSGGREALVLPMVENVVAWRSLIARDLRLHSFVIEGPKLAVRRDAQGELFVAGIRISGDRGDGKLTDWILSQREIVVRGAEVEWLDESRKAPALSLSGLSFRLANDGDAHAIGLSARPPRELGPGLEVRAALAGSSVKQPANWNGRVYAEFGYTNLAGWRAWVDYPLDVRRGEGALRLWATLSGGRISQATADVALSNVSARLGKDLPVLEISAVRGRVYGRETAGGYDFGVRNLALARPGAPAMNATSFRAIWQPASSTTLAQRGSVSANLIELAPLAHLAEFLPFPADLRKLLAELAPQGNLLDAKFDWTGELPDQASFSAKTRFAGLSMNAWRSIPGFAGLSGTVEATDKKGVVRLASQKSELDLPTVFPEPRIQLESLNGEVGWERAGADAGIAVRLANLSFANEDFAGTAYGSYAWSGEGPGVVDLSAQLSRADGRKTAKYLPLSTLMGARAREWVANAVLAGEAGDVRLRLKGDLRDFPFVDPAKGQFQVAARVSGGVLDYASGWPRIEQIEAELMFERDRIDVVGRSGSILGAKIANVRVTLPSVFDERPRLHIDGGAEGATALFLDYIRESPVRRMIDGFTDGIASVGRGKLRLRLDLMLHEMAASKVAGEYQFAANAITVDPRLPPIQRASGLVSFTESSLAIQDVRGQLFGDQVRISGGSGPETGVTVVAEGRATIEGMRPLFDHPWRRRLSGASRYTAAVTVKDGRVQLNFDSPLEGVASTLPAPLSKTAGETLPLRIEVLPGEGRDRISIALGPQAGRIATAEFLRAGQGREMRVQRSLITLNPVAGETQRIPERRGMTVRGALPVLDLERWLPLFAEGGISAEGISYDLKVGILDALGKRMRSVAMQGATDGTGWSATMSTAEFAGDVVYRSEGSGRLVARFARFTLPEDAPSVKPGEALKELPAVDIVADSFTHRGRKLGRVEVQARHEGRDWRIEKLAMTNPDSALTGSGLWRQAEGSLTSLDFKLAVSDVGRFLERFGYPDHLKAGHGKLEGALTWKGDPVTIDYATLAGKLQMQAEDGQFLEIEPGIGKLVSLMSLQMLPRRIALDFRDVFSKGFQFDRIASSMDIERGVMAVKEFRMRGPAAEVEMTGQVDLSLETQNLSVKVIPQLGDTASTVVGLVNPIAGFATLIAGRLLKNPLGKIFAFEYAISGTWTDPKVEKVQPPAPPPDPLESSGIPIR